MDVAQIIKNEVDAGDRRGRRIARADARLSGARRAVDEQTGRDRTQFLLIPASNAGKVLGEAVAALFPDLRLVSVPGQSDLMFLSEQGSLTFEELTGLLKPCRSDV